MKFYDAAFVSVLKRETGIVVNEPWLAQRRMRRRKKLVNVIYV
jgi:hypothetical protein